MADGDGIRKADAQLRYYFHIARPEDLCDEEWAMRVKELEWVRKEEAKANRSGF